MLAYKVFGAGITGLALEAMGRDVASGLTAAGSTKSDAYECTFSVNAFTTVAAGTGAILDSHATKGDSQIIYNGGDNVLKVYPPSGAQLNGLTADLPHLLAPKTSCLFPCISATLWTGILSA